MNIMDTVPAPKWRKSTYSNPSGNCVEVAENVEGSVLVRDSKHPEIGHLKFSHDDWYGVVHWLGSLSPTQVSAN